MYPYITENNLLQPQRYSYTPFGGAAFLSAYLATRMEIVQGGVARADIAPAHCPNLMPLLKTFEIHKRIYARYSSCRSALTGDTIIKPDKQSSFTDVRAYHDFAAALLCALRRTHHLLYLNTLLKLNDTFLSIPELFMAAGGGGAFAAKPRCRAARNRLVGKKAWIV